jgi:hypothetical protein
MPELLHHHQVPSIAPSADPRAERPTVIVD